MILREFCAQRGIPFLSYDPTGLGASTPPRLVDSTIAHWLEDAKVVLTRLTSGPTVVVGSSMGCWLAASLLRSCPERVAGLLLLSPALNFGPQYRAALTAQLSAGQRAALEGGEVVALHHPVYGALPLHRRHFDAFEAAAVSLEPGALRTDVPARIIFSIQDTDVPLSTPIR